MMSKNHLPYYAGYHRVILPTSKLVRDLYTAFAVLPASVTDYANNIEKPFYLDIELLIRSIIRGVNINQTRPDTLSMLIDHWSAQDIKLLDPVMFKVVIEQITILYMEFTRILVMGGLVSLGHVADWKYLEMSPTTYDIIIYRDKSKPI